MDTKPAHAYSEPEGPFRARQIRDGDPYELSNGHPIKCMSAGERHGKANLQGALALATDPGIQGQAGTDVGIEFNEGKNLRAPDLVLGIEGNSGWAKKIPPIAVEYADRGQDEAQLKEKITELLQAGMRFIWVVRLAGPLRVEVYEPGKKMRIVDEDGSLTAPGVLVNSYTPRQLVEREEALRASFRNQLQALGYESLAAVQEESRLAGHQEGHRAGHQEGHRAGHQEGRLAGERTAIYDLCELLDIPVNQDRKQLVEQMDLPALTALRQTLKTERRWPQ